jgi:ATP-dependent exoDNAse (exonuclease V) alpha subunit
MIRTTISGKTVEKDFTYAYASTIHKSQGSSIDIVYVNLRDLFLRKTKDGDYKMIKNTRYDNHSILKANRLFYVAASRAIEKVIFLWL